LGVKTEDPKPDIVPDENGAVYPFSGGMSVSPDTLRNLPDFKLSPRFGGNNNNPDPVWCINSAFVYGTNGLQYTGESATHGLIEPNKAMPLMTYQRYLSATQPFWIKITEQK
jgi:hypothetical protein